MQSKDTALASESTVVQRYYVGERINCDVGANQRLVDSRLSLGR